LGNIEKFMANPLIFGQIKALNFLKEFSLNYKHIDIIFAAAKPFMVRSTGG